MSDAIDAFTMSLQTVPVLDTGIGRAHGYPSDREFIKARELEMALRPEVERDLLAKLNAAVERKVLGL